MSSAVERLTWFGTPVLITFTLHVLLFVALATKFSAPETVVARVSKPVAIQAALIRADSLKPPKQTLAPPKPKPKPKSKPEPKPEPKRLEPVTKKADVAPVTPQTVEKVATLERPEVTEDVITRSAEQSLSEEALANLEATLETDRAPQAGAAGSVSDTVAAIIQRAVINRWTRPPSARNGMRAVLEIALVPTGDVVGVAILSTSGDVAFDRSAVNAVEKAGRFPEVREVERAVFERDFRRFQLIFKPEDLRY